MVQKQELVTFKENVDSWIKDINKKFSELKDVSGITDENTNNIDHNYELVNELREELYVLKEEIKLLKLNQVLLVKDQLEKIKDKI